MRRALLLAAVLGGGLPTLPAGYVFLIDSDGVFLVDSTGAFLIEVA